MPIAALTETEFGLMQSYIEARCGIAIHPSKRYLVETRLAGLVARKGCSSFGEFHDLASSSPERQLVDDIIDAATTNETSWFRDGAPWLAFRDVILPEFGRLAAEKPGRRFRIWSAGCSTGQEPYSLAMLISEFCGRNGRGLITPDHFQIIGTDISSSALSIALAGKYDRISMRRGFSGEWESLRDKYFRREGRVSLLRERIKNLVAFKKFNLQRDFAQLGFFHVVFLRNVTIYFSDFFRRDVLERMMDVLIDPGYIFLGAAETPLDDSGRLRRHIYGRAFYYSEKCRRNCR